VETHARFHPRSRKYIVPSGGGRLEEIDFAFLCIYIYIYIYIYSSFDDRRNDLSF